jgi:hypothetical protein
MPNQNHEPMIWKLLVIAAIALIIISFAFVFVPGVSEPTLFSLPYILWTSILSTVLLVVLTFLGSRFFSSKNK